MNENNKWLTHNGLQRKVVGSIYVYIRCQTSKSWKPHGSVHAT